MRNRRPYIPGQVSVAQILVIAHLNPNIIHFLRPSGIRYSHNDFKRKSNSHLAGVSSPHNTPVSIYRRRDTILTGCVARMFPLDFTVGNTGRKGAAVSEPDYLNRPTMALATPALGDCSGVLLRGAGGEIFPPSNRFNCTNYQGEIR